MKLSADSFSAFFDAVHRSTSDTPTQPYPWQQRLAENAVVGDWPGTIRIPTGLGKTGAITVAVFCTAMNPDAPTRTVYVVDRRTVIDAAYDHALHLQDRLETAPEGTLLHEIAQRLRARAGLFGEVRNGPALVVSRLRGGERRDNEWLQSPTTPAVILGTVDQIGSRYLHRGYGVSWGSRPIHAGLLGMDSLLLLDEPHLSTPFLQTITATQRFQPTHSEDRVSPLKTVILGATLPAQALAERPDDSALELNSDDLADPRIAKLLNVSRPLKIAGSKDSIESLLTAAIDKGAHRIAVMVNTVGRSREAWRALQRAEPAAYDLELVIGRSRPGDRREIEQRLVKAIGPQALPPAESDRPLVVIATQTLEVGADISFDTIITEAAPWPNLVQRAGRMLRRGEPHAGSFIVIPASTKHPAYGKATDETLKMLKAWVKRDGDSAQMGYQGIDAITAYYAAHESETEAQTLALCHPPVTEAPILLSEHINTWTQTSPEPVADIAVGPFLHGVSDRADDVRIVWRTGIEKVLAKVTAGQTDVSMSAFGLDVLPIRDAEILEVPVAAALSFLRGAPDSSVVADDMTSGSVGQFADATRQLRKFLVHERGEWLAQSYRSVRPGSLVIVDVAAGGLLTQNTTADGDSRSVATFYGWDPASSTTVSDRSEGTFDSSSVRFRLTTLLTAAKSQGIVWLADELREVQGILTSSTSAEFSLADRRTLHRDAVERLNTLVTDAIPTVIPQDSAFLTNGIRLLAAEDVRPGWFTEDGPTDWVLNIHQKIMVDATKPIRQSLPEHGRQVAALAGDASTILGLSKRDEIVLAARHHDAGKTRLEWQRSIGAAPPDDDPTDILHDQRFLAKSGTNPPRTERDRQRKSAGLEDGWRHEAFSVQILKELPASEPAEHFGGSHHGEGRPFYRSRIPNRPEQNVTHDQAGRFRKLIADLGPWRLAHHEAILRLSDWTASGFPQSAPLVQAAKSLVEPSVAKSEATAASSKASEQTVLSALSGDNLADYCAAVGILRMLNRIEPTVTLHWNESTPVITWPGTIDEHDPSLLRKALDQMVMFRDEIVELSGGTVVVTGSKTKIDITEYREIARAFSHGSPDAQAWLSGCHDETVRQKDISLVTNGAGAIWAMGNTDPWSQIDGACNDYLLSQEDGRRATTINDLLDQINVTLQKTPGKLHFLRDTAASAYGLDYRSGSYRAKADRDSGYVPFLVAFAHLGFNFLFRPRTRRTCVNGRQKTHYDPVQLDIWLHEIPLTVDGIHAALAAVRVPEWLGERTQHFQTTQLTTGKNATFYGQARRVETPPQTTHPHQ